MPLIDIFENRPETLENMSLQQIVMLAGDGKLKDGEESQKEFQKYLSLVDPNKLIKYAQYCLDNVFPDSGFFLQDVVNEVGRRLQFEVTNGRYRGIRNENGYDGLWKSSTGISYVVETKTTSAYTIQLETIARYREGLIEEGQLDKNSAILFVVGRQETQGLEQQIRGSRFAWSMRVVGVDALLKLMRIHLSALSDEVTSQIHEIFKPVDYTRVDPIVDVVFVTSEDREESEGNNEEEIGLPDNTNGTRASNAEKREVKKQEIANAFSRLKGKQLIQRKRVSFSDANDTLRVAISISKRHDTDSCRYWYGHINQLPTFLAGCENSFMVYGCLDRQEAYAIPYHEMESFRESIGLSSSKDNRAGQYHIIFKEKGGNLYLYLPKQSQDISLDPYRFEL